MLSLPLSLEWPHTVESFNELLSLISSTLCRFFFISDDELLSVLGTADPTSIQEHMLKLFDNCASLTFSRGNKAVTGMTSSEVRENCLALAQLRTALHRQNTNRLLSRRHIMICMPWHLVTQTQQTIARCTGPE